MMPPARLRPVMARAAVVAAAVLAASRPSPAAADGAPQVRIDARGGSVVVESDAAAATIFVGDRLRGVVTPGTSLTISLPEGTHRLAIEVAGYQRYEHVLAVQRGKTASLRATLSEGTIELASPYDASARRIALISPYDSPPGGIVLVSPYRAAAAPPPPPPPRIELESPYEAPAPTRPGPGAR